MNQMESRDYESDDLRARKRDEKEEEKSERHSKRNETPTASESINGCSRTWKRSDTRTARGVKNDFQREGIVLRNGRERGWERKKHPRAQDSILMDIGEISVIEDVREYETKPIMWRVHYDVARKKTEKNKTTILFSP